MTFLRIPGRITRHDKQAWQTKLGIFYRLLFVKISALSAPLLLLGMSNANVMSTNNTSGSATRLSSSSELDKRKCDPAHKRKS